MTHFNCLVICPQDARADIMSAVEQLLAPYDENIVVDEYDKRCPCVGMRAATLAKEEADAACGSRQAIYAAFVSANPLPDDFSHEDIDSDVFRERQRKLELALATWHETRDAALDRHPDKDAPSTTCTNCKGSGRYRSTYNPKSKWDYWVPVGFQKDVSTYQDEHPFWAVVTPDGEWHARGDVGWFGATSNEIPDWTEKLAELIKQYADHPSLFVDCHI